MQIKNYANLKKFNGDKNIIITALLFNLNVQYSEFSNFFSEWRTEVTFRKYKLGVGICFCDLETNAILECFANGVLFIL